jgi:hypothetical protein
VFARCWTKQGSLRCAGFPGDLLMALDAPGIDVLQRRTRNGQLPMGWPSQARPVKGNGTPGLLALRVCVLARAPAASCGLIAIRVTGSVAKARAVAVPQRVLP